ncbi:AlwI family type II restriction endonuclease [Brevibacterium linens]|nr:AlwI family type II restriction endonuclease [Brevibacterium linens]
MSKAHEQDIAFALDGAGVIALSEDTVDVTSIARKWRGALVKLGFLWPDISMLQGSRGIDQYQIGAPFTLTPNGKRLLAAKSLQGEQEVILRSLAALHLPSPLEPDYEFPQFSPLKHVVRILDSMGGIGEEPYISRLEMASIVILTSGKEDPEEVANAIVTQRYQRAGAVAKRKFDAQAIRSIAAVKGVNQRTLYDYQDVSFRYLKATGLFQSRGRGITLVPEKRRTAKLLADSVEVQLGTIDYLNSIASGSSLPTDSQDGAADVLSDLLAVATDWSITFDTSFYDLTTPEGISLARHDLEYRIFEAKELDFAAGQSDQIDEILAYLKMLDENRTHQVFGDEQLVIPKEERPAYFEWLLWRVLLALNKLVIPPSKVRRFNIDQDFLPVSTAAGGGADVVAEYDECVLVVEVTLTENSRQEAAEGEPVRRHVADVLEQFEPLGKDVYGLFIARRIDTNTAETFRIGVWYLKNDKRVDLDVVPLTLSQLIAVLRDGVDNNKLGPGLLFELIKAASLLRQESSGAPEWKSRIAQITTV